MCICKNFHSTKRLSLFIFLGQFFFRNINGHSFVALCVLMFRVGPHPSSRNSPILMLPVSDSSKFGGVIVKTRPSCLRLRSKQRLFNRYQLATLRGEKRQKIPPNSDPIIILSVNREECLLQRSAAMKRHRSLVFSAPPRP